MTNKEFFSQFTNQYSLQKTLRFELEPYGKDGKPLSEEEATKILKLIRENDRKIKQAYLALKPVMDKIHEDVINNSLSSVKAKSITFNEYYENYKQKKEKGVALNEKSLREAILETFDEGAKFIKNKAGVDSKGKPLLKETGIRALTKSGILRYIDKNSKDFISEKLTENDLKKYLVIFKGFFTYFSGYNQNRENYYAKNGEATAVATRIVNENLPKFCDNCIQFSEGKAQKKKRKLNEEAIISISRKEEYLNVYQFLKDGNRTTQIKDAVSNTMIEAYPIEEKMFEIAKFSEYLSQSGIDEYNKIIGHYNLLINLYNQACKEEQGFKKLLPFKTLYKQIGCGEKKPLFYAIKYNTLKEQQKQREEDENVNEILNLEGVLKRVKEVGYKYFLKSSENSDIQHFTDWLKQTNDWDGIYWSKSAVDKVSDKYFNNWHDIRDKLKGNKSYVYIDKNKELQLNEAVELSGLFNVLDYENYQGWSKVIFKQSVLEDRHSIIDEKHTPSQNLISLICADMQELAKDFRDKSEDILAVTDYKKEENILKIKEWLDTAIAIVRIIKYFEVKESKVKGNAINPELSNILTTLLHSADTKWWFEWYDAVRSYLTKKPQDDAKANKLKLNFEIASFLNGFVDSYSDSDNATQYGGYLFRKKVASNVHNEYQYFLGISKNSELFRCHLQNEIQQDDKSLFERLEYYQARNTTYFDTKYSENKAKLIVELEKAIDNFVKYKSETLLNEESDEIKKRDRNGEITPSTLIKRINKNKDFNHILSDENVLNLINQTIIDIKESCKNFIRRAPKLEIIENKEYRGSEGLRQIIEDLQVIAKENKVFNFFNISQYEFEDAFTDETKPLYLFKISNKDLNFQEGQKGNKGIENLHTLYFRGLMREYDNLIPIDIGKGEVFFREKTAYPDKAKITHPANQPIKRRSDGKTESVFNHDIIKDKRFKKEKYHLHLSIALNFNPEKEDVNELVNDNFTKADDIRFLGIDRGEKHLIYYSLLDAKGNIIEQNHLDIINKKDYLQEINDAAKKRREKQENWQQKGNIKNLKDGYISLVVHEIVQKMKHKQTGEFNPTFIVMEDLNTGFKRSRQKFEQQVYQKFELALAKKLNYLVDKNVPMGETGSVIKALQLTPPVDNYQDIENKKQVGIMLYTRANYTSVTDPATGWRKTIYLKTGKEEDIKKQIIESFKEIGVNNQGDYYFQYSNENSGKEWILWSGVNGKSLERYRFRRGNNKNEGIVETYRAKEMLDKLFKEFDLTRSLREQLENGEHELAKIDERTAWESFRFVIDIIQQIRNSGDITKSQDDNFLLSPVRNNKGEHFDTRTQLSELPKDADANGAYNIARKGIIMCEHIKQWIKDGKQRYEKGPDLDLFISDKEWDMWTINKEKWKERLPMFASRRLKEKQALAIKNG